MICIFVYIKQGQQMDPSTSSVARNLDTWEDYKIFFYSCFFYAINPIARIVICNCDGI